MPNKRYLYKRNNFLILFKTEFTQTFYLFVISANMISSIKNPIKKIIMDSFGKQRLKDFYVDPKYVNVNHGSYGLSPKSVIEYQRSLQ